MPKREFVVRLEDVLYRINRIEDMIVTIGSPEALASNLMFRDAMERNFEIIGEAMFQIRKMSPDTIVTGRDKIIALRHIITHDYYDVDPKQLWATANKHLPLLKQEIIALIGEESQRLFGTDSPELDL